MKTSLTIFFLIPFLISCTAKIDQSSVKASNNIPEAAKVDEVLISYDDTLPTIYMTVEPIQVREVSSESNIAVTNDYRGNRSSNDSTKSTSNKKEEDFIDDHSSSKQKDAQKDNLPKAFSPETTYVPVVNTNLDGVTTKQSQHDYARHKQGGASEAIDKKQVNSYKNQVEAQNNLNINLKQYRQYFLSRQRQITNQLNSSLAGVKNFKLLDYEINKKTNFNFNKKSDNDLGPYLVRAVITECNDQVKYQKDKSSIPLFYSNKDVEIVKMVGLDIQLIDPHSGEVVQAFPVQGSYTYKDASVDGGFIVDFSTSKLTVQSSIDQALRVALNDAAKKLYNGLRK
jgi:hypothetical protein